MPVLPLVGSSTGRSGVRSPEASAAPVLDPARGGGPASRGREDGDHGALVQRRIEGLEVPDVFVVQVDVDEAVEPAVGAADLRPEAWVADVQVLQHLAPGAAFP